MSGAAEYGRQSELDGAAVEQTIDGYKFETLVLDMVACFRDVLPYNVDRKDEFLPIKNKTGVDSLEGAMEELKRLNTEGIVSL